MPDTAILGETKTGYLRQATVKTVSDRVPDSISTTRRSLDLEVGAAKPFHIPELEEWKDE
ncbi:MAG: hypothetical protein AAFY57_06830 [Cyanobacteria bacterium J06642_2]